MKAEQLTDPLCYHAEGPVWSERWGGLRWVDMLAGDVLTLGADGSIDRRNVGTIAAVVRPRRGGGAVIAIERGFLLEDTEGELTELPPVFDDERLRMNEGGCDPDGRFYCGSMAYDHARGAGSVYRLAPDGSVDTVLDGVTISNGLEWTPDGTRAYYIDTPTGRIDVFDYDRDGGLTARRPFVETGGAPDGLTVDADGGVWVAFYDGGAVHRYGADGTLDEVVEVGARQVTACTLGGANLDELFITTSREHLEPGDDPLAGALFHADAGVRGRPVREFAG
jgi:sugar lactone lactonase YvrE